MAEQPALSESSNQQTASTGSDQPPSKTNTTGGGAAGGSASPRPRKGPFSFLSGSLTSFGFGWLALQLSSRVVAYYGEHPPHYEARFAQSIAVFMKTLIVGMTFLATFTFAFVGVGLFLTFIRSLLPGWSQAEETP
mgnify:CR=1 FL=1